ncbi:hypothetical protein ASA1KI_45870 [Opitutales bacterium ASA1]|uniref:hypothetical protein n=1 Tax=Congregicoccus parvus TaxID=3081749 RepID=UPI002B2E397C|nr:hypothetical protein ASA1KI_45870 [Opitutales bacterium ASA1]
MNSPSISLAEERPVPSAVREWFGLSLVQWALLACFAAYLAAVSWFKVDSFEHYLRLYQDELSGPSRMLSLHVVISSGAVFAAAVMLALSRTYRGRAEGEAGYRIFSASMIFALGMFAVDARLRITAHTAPPLGDVLYGILLVALALPLLSYREHWTRHPAAKYAVAVASSAGVLVMVVDLTSGDHESWHLWTEEILRATAGVAWSLFAWSVLVQRMHAHSAYRIETAVAARGGGLVPMWITIGVLIAAGAWAGAFAGDPSASLAKAFHLDGEWTVPAFASTLLLILASVVAAAVAVEARMSGSRWHRHWVVLAAGFAYMAVDETASLHEMWGDPVKRVLPLDGTIFQFAWVVVAFPLVLGLAIYFWPMVWKLDSGDRNRLIASGFVFLGGALGMEMVGSWLYVQGGTATTTYQLIVVCEEGLELAGLGLVVRALHLMLRRGTGSTSGTTLVTG